jgi:hypothetical protein
LRGCWLAGVGVVEKELYLRDLQNQIAHIMATGTSTYIAHLVV